MQFAKVLRDRVLSGEITSSVRIWTRPHVKAGGRYQLSPGVIFAETVQEITEGEITLEMAQESGFDSIEDLLQSGKHGRGERVFLVRFRFE